MNELTIKQRSTGTEYRFWMPSQGGYVHLDTTGSKPGTLGEQICRGGRVSGSTLSATPETFEKVCRNWYRAYVRRHAAH